MRAFRVHAPVRRGDPGPEPMPQLEYAMGSLEWQCQQHASNSRPGLSDDYVVAGPSVKFRAR